MPKNRSSDVDTARAAIIERKFIAMGKPLSDLISRLEQDAENDAQQGQKRAQLVGAQGTQGNGYRFGEIDVAVYRCLF